MALKTALESLDEVDEVFREHYVESTDPKGKKIFVLGLDGPIDPLPQVKSLRSEAGNYRIKLREAEAKYGKIAGFEGMDHAEVVAKLDRIAELEAANGGKIDDSKLNEIVEGRLKAKLAPVERERDGLRAENLTLKQDLDNFRKTEKERKIGDAVRQAAVAMKMEPTAVDDAIMYAERVMEVDETGNVVVKDAVGFTPGIDAKTWLGDMQAKRPHWWGPSAGGGGRGNAGGTAGDRGVNPWTAESWNMTLQGQILTTDPKKAERLAAAAGTKIGGVKPKPTK